MTSSPSSRAWLKELATASDCAWMTRVLPPSLDGRCRVETMRTVYVFVDAVCTEVARRDEDPDHENTMLGMQLMGWVVDHDGDRLVVHAWRPGARAILWRPRAGGERQCQVALTSTTFAFVRARPPRREPPAERAPELRPVPPSALSATRVDIPMLLPA